MNMPFESKKHADLAAEPDSWTRRKAGNGPESPLKTQGEIESAVCQGMRLFEQQYMGRGPKDIHAHLLGDLIVVRLQGVLTEAERNLAKTASNVEGKDLIKQVRSNLIQVARPALDALIGEITGVEVLSL